MILWLLQVLTQHQCNITLTQRCIDVSVSTLPVFESAFRLYLSLCLVAECPETAVIDVIYSLRQSEGHAQQHLVWNSKTRTSENVRTGRTLPPVPEAPRRLELEFFCGKKFEWIHWTAFIYSVRSTQGSRGSGFRFSSKVSLQRQGEIDKKE